MITLRPAADRGHADHGWLNSWHSFSFAEYQDPEHVRFGTLRVLNDDTVAAKGGFAPHPHRDMEIISYVLSGGLQHKDSMGTGSVIRRGDVQRMSAGTGVVHSEFNASDKEPVHFLQIWIFPERSGLQPGYEQVSVPDSEKRGRLRVIAARNGGDNVVTVHQDVVIAAGLFDGDEQETRALQTGRQYYLHVADGAITVNGQRLQAGDALKLIEEKQLRLEQGQAAEVLLFDLAA
ncbi:pirin family protein [Permianibacter sp. IMCC34836]|uniref:pirin family protein n=1 Tax=Permianibacter fluminis TaxID=2738515 RepID=UPI0015518854|nr:pirin family protein [Permianibacter fluminis]NQD38655.1 pirin family protein [Permianibacter fluminis]